MKFQPDRADGVNLITRYAPGEIWVGAAAHCGAVIVPWQGTVAPWTASRVEELTEADFSALLSLQPELVIYGSGNRLVFPPPSKLRTLIEARIGLETMDTAAACRTYNVLASEGRHVVAALLPAT